MSEKPARRAPDRILIVDDEPGNRLLLSATLEKAGYIVDEVENGHQALEYIRCQRIPDLVLLDIIMPDLDGFATCEAIRTVPAAIHVPIVMMTGLDDSASIQRAYEVGATDFVTKPINPLLIRHRLRYVLRACRIAHALHTSERRLSEAQRIACIGHWEWNTASDAADAAGIEEIFGTADINPFIDSEQFLDMVHPDDRERVEFSLMQNVNARQPYTLEHRILRSDGEERVVRHDAVFKTEDGASLVMSTVQDVTERKLSEQRIHHLAHYDELTGLPKRNLFNSRLAQAMQSARRFSHSIAVLVLDLDHFSRINETKGYQVGNEILIDVARRLRSRVRDGDRGAMHSSSGGLRNRMADEIARLSGDQFSILLAEIRSIDDANHVVERVTSALASPFSVGADDYHVNASIGVSVFPSDGGNPDTMLDNASIAMKHAKELGRNRCHFYTTALNEKLHRQLSLETQLRKALDTGALQLHYQPIVDITNETVVGAEALLRWPNPELGMVPPDEFIPIAEKIALIEPLGEWVFQTATRQLQEWRSAGLDLRIAINLSAAHFRTKGLAEEMARRLGRLDARYVDLELTEGLLLADRDGSVATLAALREIGFGVSVDDFGTGYSSLAYLKRFPISTLKIDRSFVGNLPSDRGDMAIVSAVIKLGHDLGLDLVAEGIESTQQLDVLRSQGCDKAQGFHFSKALPAQQFIDWYERFKARLCSRDVALDTAD